MFIVDNFLPVKLAEGGVYRVAVTLSFTDSHLSHRLMASSRTAVFDVPLLMQSESEFSQQSGTERNTSAITVEPTEKMPYNVSSIEFWNGGSS